MQNRKDILISSIWNAGTNSFGVVNLLFFYNFLSNVTPSQKKLLYLQMVKQRFTYYLNKKKRIALTCNGKRRKFSKGASMASGSHALCVGCNFHFFANWFSYDHPLKCGNSVHAFIVSLPIELKGHFIIIL